MKETGLMFKAPLVRAILAGKKTQTRRIIKNQPFDRGAMRDHRMAYMSGRAAAGDEVDGLFAYTESSGGTWSAKSPAGQPGDRIYVRETWAHGIHAMAAARDEDGPFVYAADGAQAERGRLGDQWKPSIHMPKHAARIWLEITGVRVERLQKITDTDCWAEGAITEARPDQFSVHSVIATDGKAYLSPRGAFSSLWESTGGDWAADPWVWVIDFKTISTTGRPA